MNDLENVIYEFAGRRVDPARRQLLHDGRPVVLLGSWRIQAPEEDGRPPGCYRAETPEQAVALALEAAPVSG